MTVLLTVKHVLTPIIMLLELSCPIRDSQWFGCRAAFYSADCGVAVFVILMIGVSTKNPSGRYPNAYVCFQHPEVGVWTQVVWHCITCVWTVWILISGIYAIASRAHFHRSAEQIAEADAAEVLANAERGVNLLQGLSVSELGRMPVVGHARGTSNRAATTCSICLALFFEGAPTKVLRCQHEFHVDCIDAWLSTKNSCPLCRSLAVVR
jgi:hypothetical protein